MSPTCIHTQTIDAFGASALMITSYVCHMFKVLIQNYTTCEGYMVIDAACTKYKVTSKECWSTPDSVCGACIQTAVVLCSTAHTELVCGAARAVGVVLALQGAGPPTKQTGGVSHNVS